MVRFFRGGRYANVTSTAALVVALGGTGAYAANTIGSGDIKNNSIRSVDIKNRQVKRQDLANNAVTSTKVGNRSLRAIDFKSGELPAGARGGTGPTGPARSVLRIGAGAPADCNPSSLNRVVCETVALTLASPGRVLLVADSGWFGNAAAPTRGTCRLAVDGLEVTGAGAEVGETVDTTDANHLNYFGMNFVTGLLPAGAHTFSFVCNEVSGDIVFNDGTLSAMYAGAL